MRQFRFLDWQVYKDAQELFSLLLKIVKKMPREYRHELGTQLLRSGSSIILNIAEGGGKQSEKEFNRFIETGLGSAYETLANLDTLRSNKLMEDSDFEAAKKYIASICSQLGGLKKRLDL